MDRGHALRTVISSFVKACKSIMLAGIAAFMGKLERRYAQFFDGMQQLGLSREALNSLFTHGRKMDSSGASSDFSPDVVFIIPNNNATSALYRNAVAYAHYHDARLGFLCFETENWFNTYSPVKREKSSWAPWLDIQENLDLVLSSSKEGSKYAREFFCDVPDDTAFSFCYPSVNSRLADSLPRTKKGNEVVVFSRFFKSEHKGINEISQIFCEALSGFTVVFIVGVGEVPSGVRDALRDRADNFEINLDFAFRISEEEKFELLKRARLVLFPSYFEGFGLPPLEASYSETPCVAFDLPVLREIYGDLLFYAPPGDWEQFRAQIKMALIEDVSEHFNGDEVVEVASFQSYARRLDKAVSGLFSS